MIHCKKFLLSLALTTMAMAAHADINSKSLEVKGTIRTPTCQVNLPDGGVYDYGTMSLSVLPTPTSEHLALEKKTKTWAVDCGSAQTYLSVSFADLRSGSLSVTGDNRFFGLGSVDGIENSKIGYYMLTLSNAKVDGNPRSIGILMGNAAYATAATETMSIYRAYTWWTSTATGGWTAVAGAIGSHFEMDIAVSPFLASKSVVGGGSPVVSQVNMDGLVAVTYAFGL